LNLSITAQHSFLAVHVLLLVNVVVNFAYASAPIEQANVMTSNIAQILIPLILSRLSELMTNKFKATERDKNVMGEEPEAE
jgi:hypothetical protein